ncbi:MAG TPA: VOC family protein [Anaerolineales bacterium]|nr:VOC family protein [Anaerolineales bacterium]
MNTNRSMPSSVVIPELPYTDVREAVDWLCRSFGFKERLRIGNHRAQLTFGEGSIVVTEKGSDPNAAYSVMVRVADVDTHYEYAKQTGASIISPPTDYPYGERQYVVEDPGGHRWTFSQTIVDIDPRTWGGILFE